MHSTGMQTQRENHWTIQQDVRVVFLLEQPRIYQGGTNLARKLQRGATTWKDMLENCVERYCDLANKKTEQLYKVSNPCLDDHQN